eukprot:CAMPEP_0194143262 /NCGR_PEP_ID=MMETSP0152-20130528/12443_1 /TAXON_ID=1049557 /ORGANISM="Thalassiothrix antarctica, Strain L6-D1" /LENGTH=1068 /DNA_ID=CAMNT_0038842585 /DNA_START=431 /DNA_END=3637 /DNA_ORIENTATION=-
MAFLQKGSIIIPSSSGQGVKTSEKYYYPKVSNDYVPLPLDSNHLPNVVYGCGQTERRVDEIQIHVIGYRRAPSLERLLDQLRNATYEGWGLSIPLYLHLDGGATDWVKNIVRRYEWEFGPKILDIRTQPHGLRGMWLTSMGAAAKVSGNNTLMVVLEDDIRVSKYYFQGLLALVDQYGRNPECRDSNLMGFSLSPIRLEELRKPFTRWNAQKAMGQRGQLVKPHLAYLSVVPSSWGSAFWSDRWNEFAKFCELRAKPPYYDHQAEAVASHEKSGNNYDELRMTPPELYVPDSRSNVWPKSWKRFMIDFMYARGNVMIYPSLPGEKGFASTLALSGEHVFSATRKSRSNNARVTALIESFDIEEMGMLPRYGNLAVFDLHLKLTTREVLVAEGMKFMHNVRDHCNNCEELLNVWARPGTFSASSKHHQGTFSICAPDLYMPAGSKPNGDALSAQISSSLPSPTQRYLLFEPQYGANNQLLAIVEGLYWASILDRQLVLPPMFLPRVADFISDDENEWPATDKILEFGELSTSSLVKHYTNNLYVPSPPIGFHEWKKTLQQQSSLRNRRRFKTDQLVSRILRITRDAVFDTPKQKLTTALMKNSKKSIPIVNIRHLFEKKMPSAADLQHLFGGCSDEVLTFQGMFFADIKGVDKYALSSEVVSLTEYAQKTYSSIKTQLQEKLGDQEYNCFHVRLGDFVSMCSTVDQGKSNIPFYNNLIKQGFQCAVSAEKVISAVTHHNKPVFIMTDNSTSLFNAGDFSSSLPIVTSEWVQEMIAEELSLSSFMNTDDYDKRKTLNKAEADLMNLIIEQELCKDAKHAVLNRFSTVSRRISYLRDDKAVSYWRNTKTRKLASSDPEDEDTIEDVEETIETLLQKHDIYIKDDNDSWKRTTEVSSDKEIIYLDIGSEADENISPDTGPDDDENKKTMAKLIHNIYVKDDNDSWKRTTAVTSDTEIGSDTRSEADEVIGPSSPDTDEEINPNTSPDTDADSETDADNDTDEIIKNEQNLNTFLNSLHKYMEDDNSSQKLKPAEGDFIADDGVPPPSTIQNEVIEDDQNILQEGQLSADEII